MTERGGPVWDAAFYVILWFAPSLQQGDRVVR